MRSDIRNRCDFLLYDGIVPARTVDETVLKGDANKQLGTVLRAENLTRLPWLLHGFSTRIGASSLAYGKLQLNLGFTRNDSKAAVARNRTLFLCALADEDPGGKDQIPSSPWVLITLRQVHSDIIHCINSVPNEALVGDGLLTSTPGLLLAIQTADCLPIILADTKRRAIGVFHAGWRGTVKRIVETQPQFQTSPCLVGQDRCPPILDLNSAPLSYLLAEQGRRRFGPHPIRSVGRYRRIWNRRYFVLRRQERHRRGP